MFGLEYVSSRLVTGDYQLLSSGASAYSWIDGNYIRDITKFAFSAPDNITECWIDIYAR